MTPVWIFPAYPLLIVGPHAGNLARKVSPEAGLRIIVGGFVLQGIGFMVSLMIYSAFLYRLMTHKLPTENVRPGMFVSVGPSGFTIAGVITMGQALPRVVDDDFMGDGLGELVGTITMVGANWFGIWLWGSVVIFIVPAFSANLSDILQTGTLVPHHLHRGPFLFCCKGQDSLRHDLVRITFHDL
jgi:tellurite resistance protein TehA-like permease